MITSKKFKKYVRNFLGNFKNDFPSSLIVTKKHWDSFCSINGNGNRFIITISRGYMKQLSLLFAVPFVIYHEIGHIFCNWEYGQTHNRFSEIYSDKFAVEQMVKYKVHFIWLRLFVFFIYRKFKQLGIYRTLYHYYHVLFRGVPEEDLIGYHPFEIERFLYCWKYLIMLRLHCVKKSQ